jgi:glycosyltransferase involved in cell wall biosynthesis
VVGLKVALYHAWIYLKGGGERMIKELVSRSKYEFTIFTHYYDKASTFPEFREFEVIELDKGLKIKGVIKRGFSFAKEILKTKLDLSEFDAFIVSTGGIGELITLRNHGLPTICYCHSPLRAAHDLYDFYLKTKYKTLAKKIFFKANVFLYKFLEKLAWRHFKLVLCNSENTKERVLKAKLAPKGKVSVLNPGVDLKRFKPNWKFKKYFLAPGRITWYKRLEIAIDAFKLFKEKEKGFKLIIAGHAAERDVGYLKKIKQMVKSIGDIEMIESPVDEEYIKLYQNCYAVLFAAKNEDWGLVPLEAMACGKPIISVNEGGPRESVVHGETGFLVKANPQALCRVMQLLCKDTKTCKKIGKNARKHVQKYGWDNFVRKFDEYLEMIA